MSKILRYNELNKDLQYKDLINRIMEWLRIHYEKGQTELKFDIDNFSKESNISIEDIRELISSGKLEKNVDFNISIEDNLIVFLNLNNKENLLYEYNVGDTEIKDMNTYLQGMSKGIEDKIDFLKIIQPKCIVDFGCADGYVLNEINKKYSDIKLIGYDLDEKMINIINNKYPNIKSTDNWNEVLQLTENEKDITLSLISVIHEVYSYSKPMEINKFWKEKVFNPKWKYVYIRDMVPSLKYNILNLTDNDKYKIWLKSKNDMEKYVDSFETLWGKSITSDYRTLLHWLLKYDYHKNWDREVKENYLPVSLETIKSKIPSDWKIIYENHYTFKPIYDKVKKDFDVELIYPTHLKMIIKNLNNI